MLSLGLGRKLDGRKAGAGGPGYAQLEAAAIAAARRNDAMLLYVPDTAGNVFANADTGYVPTALGATIGRLMDQQYGASSYGPERVTNGGFDYDISGWTQTLGTVSWQAGRLRTARGAAQGGRATYALPPLVVGKTYRITCDRSIAGGVSSAGVVVTISSSSTVGSILSNYGGAAAWSQFVGTFIATQVNHWIALDTGTGTEGQYAEYDNISVREVVEADGTRGPELITNGDFSSWSADNPVGWLLAFAETAQTYVTQGSPGVRLVTTDGTFNEIYQNVATVGKTYEVTVTVSACTGSGFISNSSGAPVSFSAPGVYRAIFQAVGTGIGLKRASNGVPADFTVTSLSVREVFGYHAKQITATNKPTLTRVPRKTSGDMATNGGFDSADGWALSGGATISGGGLQLNAQYAAAEQVISGLEVGAVYEVSFDTLAATGTSQIALSGTGFSALQWLTGVVGSRTYFLATCTNASAPLRLVAPNTGTTITVDNLSLKKVQDYSFALQLDGTDDWMDVLFRDHFASGAYTFVGAWWGPVTGNSSFVLSQSSPSSTLPLVSPLFLPTGSNNAAIFERGDTGATGLTGTTYATAALGRTNVVELAQTSTPVGNFKGWLNGVLDRNINYARVAESVTTSKVTFGAAQRTTVSGYAKGTLALLCLAPSTMSDEDRRAIARFAAFLIGASYV